MGLINATFTFVLGYFIIGFIKKNKPKIKEKNIPIISNLVNNQEGISSDAYLLLIGFVIKDLLI